MGRGKQQGMGRASASVAPRSIRMTPTPMHGDACTRFDRGQPSTDHPPTHLFHKHHPRTGELRVDRAAGGRAVLKGRPSSSSFVWAANASTHTLSSPSPLAIARIRSDHHHAHSARPGRLVPRPVLVGMTAGPQQRRRQQQQAQGSLS